MPKMIDEKQNERLFRLFPVLPEVGPGLLTGALSAARLVTI